MSLHEFLKEDPQCKRLAEGAVHAVAPLLDEVDSSVVLEELDHWAHRLACRMPLPWNFHAAIDEVNRFLFQDLGFIGDRQTYDDPRNSLLPMVIERRRGLPISLCILWIELARRMGFQAVGVGLPGHFICGIENDGMGLLLFDPFNGGSPVGHETAARLVQQATGRPDAFHPRMLKATPGRTILARLVRNLHVRFLRSEVWDEALWTSTHLILLEPGDPQPLKERAIVHLRRGEPDAAQKDLEEALEQTQDPDPELEAWLEHLKSK